MIIRKIGLLALTLLLCLNSNSQHLLEVEGNGLFTSATSTNVDILNEDDNTNALLRFGDTNTTKYSLGYNGNDDAFKISSTSTLGLEDFSMSLTGRIGINTLFAAATGC